MPLLTGNTLKIPCNTKAGARNIAIWIDQHSKAFMMTLNKMTVCGPAFALALARVVLKGEVHTSGQGCIADFSATVLLPTSQPGAFRALDL